MKSNFHPKSVQISKRFLPKSQIVNNVSILKLSPAERIWNNGRKIHITFRTTWMSSGFASPSLGYGVKQTQVKNSFKTVNDDKDIIKYNHPWNQDSFASK